MADVCVGEAEGEGHAGGLVGSRRRRVEMKGKARYIEQPLSDWLKEEGEQVSGR